MDERPARPLPGHDPRGAVGVKQREGVRKGRDGRHDRDGGQMGDRSGVVASSTMLVAVDPVPTFTTSALTPVSTWM